MSNLFYVRKIHNYYAENSHDMYSQDVSLAVHSTFLGAVKFMEEYRNRVGDGVILYISLGVFNKQYLNNCAKLVYNGGVKNDNKL